MVLTEDLRRILDITISISSQQNPTMLLEKILNESMNISNADGGTLYIYKDGALHFMIMRNNSMNTYQGGNGEHIDLPPVEMDLKNVSAYAALKREVVRIDDVYDNDTFNFEGPKKYDSITGYRTKSQLVVPLVDKEQNLIGVMQLINAIKDGEVVSFDNVTTAIIKSLASESAIVLSNMILYDNVRHLLSSFVNAMTTAIDSRTPYNAHNSKNVSRLCCEFVDYVNKKGLMNISKHDRDELKMAADLHDVGKVILPLEVINKESRLEHSLEVIGLRYQLIREFIENDFLAGKLGDKEYYLEHDKLEKYYNGILVIDKAGYLDDELLALADGIIAYSYKHNNKDYKLIINEQDDLKIIKGTLSSKERKIIESHALFTEKILSEIDFGTTYKNVPFIASSHHEYLDGSGYPHKLKADDLNVYVRILTAIDIYESLTSSDRPYKKAMPDSVALNILDMMVNEGKLDKDIVSYIRMFVEERN